MIARRMQGELNKTKVTKKTSHGKHLEVEKIITRLPGNALLWKWRVIKNSVSEIIDNL